MKPRVSYRKEVDVSIELADLDARCRGAHRDLFGDAYEHLAKGGMDNSTVMFAGTLVAEYEPHDPEIGRGNCFRFVSLDAIQVTVDGEPLPPDARHLAALVGVFEGYCEENAQEIASR